MSRFAHQAGGWTWQSWRIDRKSVISEQWMEMHIELSTGRMVVEFCADERPIRRPRAPGGQGSRDSRAALMKLMESWMDRRQVRDRKALPVSTPKSAESRCTQARVPRAIQRIEFPVLAWGPVALR